MKARSNGQVHEPPRKPTFRPKPLSSAQLAGLELLLAGNTDQAVADAVGVSRETVWDWRRRNPVFMAELERRRAEIYGSACERLRALLAKAIENIAAKVEAGDFEASLTVLKAVGIYGNATMNAINEQNPERLIRQQAESRVEEERRQRYAGDSTGEILDGLGDHQATRTQAIMAELWAEYGEP